MRYSPLGLAVPLAIMAAPQPGVGIFVAIFSVGHIGTALPVMLTWLVLDHAMAGRADGKSPKFPRRWWVPLVVAVMLAWAETTDPLVLVIAIFPMLAVCLVRVVTGAVAGVRDGGLAGLRAGLLGRWLEFALATAAGVGYLISWLAAPGWKKRSCTTSSSDSGSAKRSRNSLRAAASSFFCWCVPILPWPHSPMP